MSFVPKSPRSLAIKYRYAIRLCFQKRYNRSIDGKCERPCLGARLYNVFVPDGAIMIGHFNLIDFDPKQRAI